MQCAVLPLSSGGALLLGCSLVKLETVQLGLELIHFLMHPILELTLDSLLAPQLLSSPKPDRLCQSSLFASLIFTVAKLQVACCWTLMICPHILDVHT